MRLYCGKKYSKLINKMKNNSPKNITINTDNENFSYIVELIAEARNNTLRKINEELILLYWNIGKHLSNEIQKYNWGDKFIDNAANFIKKNHPDLRGFNKRGLERMRRFYETYKDDQIASAVLTQLSWTNHLLILSSTSTVYKTQKPKNLARKLLTKKTT